MVFVILFAMMLSEVGDQLRLVFIHQPCKSLKSDLAILVWWILILWEKITFCQFLVRRKDSTTFCSGGVLQQAMVLNHSTQSYLQNKIDLSEKYSELKKFWSVYEGSQNDYFPLIYWFYIVIYLRIWIKLTHILK